MLCQDVPVKFAEFSDVFQREQFIHSAYYSYV